MNDLYSVSDIEKIFRLKDRISSRQTLLNLEEKGEIPTAKRIVRGKSIQQRVWEPNQLPEIGGRLGFLKDTKKPRVIVSYMSKGGVNKTFLLYNMARAMAINFPNRKILIVGLDIQKSITKILNKSEEDIDDLSQVKEEDLGLYHLLYEKASLEEVIKPTELPNLFYIPETSELNALEKALRLSNRKEYVFLDKLLPKVKDYHLLFDVSPSWSSLIENALVCATDLISPVSCEIGTYQVLNDYIEIVNDFFETMKIEPNMIFVASLLDKNKISMQIFGAYLSQLNNQIVSTPIRRSIIAQEAIVLKKSVIEYAPESPLAQDIYEAIIAIWDRITKAERNN